ncbi:MAG: hypothetical protein ACRDJ4_08115 [Actinomycetota bacterium]
MELEGHPTQDVVEELQRRGALVYPGTSGGPDPDHLELARHGRNPERGVWIFLSAVAYNTGFDEDPTLR